ncbi:unnamed protein product [Nesidiocoris tenuis]|uniref:Uncharacterized protein n=1 Tax=Nesidiocoris tenuis TaxID=355587 RepID=A0A6H5GUA1_9HEMI|nr:unnamed protein product [Nesidiocoris tenuis]
MELDPNRTLHPFLPDRKISIIRRSEFIFKTEFDSHVLQDLFYARVSRSTKKGREHDVCSPTEPYTPIQSSNEYTGMFSLKWFHISPQLKSRLAPNLDLFLGVGSARGKIATDPECIHIYRRLMNFDHFPRDRSLLLLLYASPSHHCQLKNFSPLSGQVHGCFRAYLPAKYEMVNDKTRMIFRLCPEKSLSTFEHSWRVNRRLPPDTFTSARGARPTTKGVACSWFHRRIAFRFSPSTTLTYLLSKEGKRWRIPSLSMYPRHYVNRLPHSCQPRNSTDRHGRRTTRGSRYWPMSSWHWPPGIQPIWVGVRCVLQSTERYRTQEDLERGANGARIRKHEVADERRISPEGTGLESFYGIIRLWHRVSSRQLPLTQFSISSCRCTNVNVTGQCVRSSAREVGFPKVQIDSTT